MFPVVKKAEENENEQLKAASIKQTCLKSQNRIFQTSILSVNWPVLSKHLLRQAVLALSLAGLFKTDDRSTVPFITDVNTPLREITLAWKYLLSSRRRGGRVVQLCWVNFQCRGVLLIRIIVWQGPTALIVGAGGGCLDIFFHQLSFLTSISLSLGDGPIQTAILSQRAVKPKTTNQPTLKKIICCFRMIFSFTMASLASGLANPYHLDKSISSFIVFWYFFLLSFLFV